MQHSGGVQSRCTARGRANDTLPVSWCVLTGRGRGRGCAQCPAVARCADARAAHRRLRAPAHRQGLQGDAGQVRCPPLTYSFRPVRKAYCGVRLSAVRVRESLQRPARRLQPLLAIQVRGLPHYVHMHGKGCLLCADTAMNTQTGSARCSNVKAGCRSKGA